MPILAMCSIDRIKSWAKEAASPGVVHLTAEFKHALVSFYKKHLITSEVLRTIHKNFSRLGKSSDRP